MLAFTMVWAYFSFSQWLIIWRQSSGEINWYLDRIHGGWQIVRWRCVSAILAAVPSAAIAQLKATRGSWFRLRCCAGDALCGSLLAGCAESFPGTSARSTI